MDHYSVLGVEKSASDEEIKKAYRKLAREHHPDISSSDTEESFKQITVAYEVLSNPEKRRIYDLGGDPTRSSGGAAGAGDPFQDIFNMASGFSSFFSGGGFGSGFGGKAAPNLNGANLLYRMQISLHDVIFGAEKEFSLVAEFKCEKCDGTGSKTFDEPITCKECKGKGQVSQITRTILGQVMHSSPCPRCKGLGITIEKPCDECFGKSRIRQKKSFTLNVPKGINSGQQIELSGQGQAGIYGGLTGNLYVEFSIKADKQFSRDRSDLHCIAKIPFTKSLIGGTAKIETPYGELEFTIRPNSKRADTIKVHGYGLPENANTEKKGNLFIHLDIHQPHKLNHKQKELIQQFEATLSDKDLETELLDQ